MTNFERSLEIVNDFPNDATSGVYITVRNGDFFLNDLGSEKMGVMRSQALSELKHLRYRSQVIATLKDTFFPEAKKIYVHQDALTAIGHIISVSGNWEAVLDYPEATSGVYVTVSNGNFYLKDLESDTTGFVHCSALVANLKYRSEVIYTLRNAFLPKAERLYIQEDALIAIDRIIEANRLLF